MSVAPERRPPLSPRALLLRRIGALEARLTQVEALLRQLTASSEREAAVRGLERSHLLFVPGPAGYAIREGAGPCPAPGAEIRDEEGRAHRVASVGRSPLGDGRRCAYLEPAARLGVPGGA